MANRTGGNQLVNEGGAGQFDTLDEFSGMSTVDIANAITLWPEGSEDQLRAIAAIRTRAPDRYHNKPPLAERIEEDIAPLKARQEELLAVATTAVIVDNDSAAKVLTMITIAKGLIEEITTARNDAIRPYDEARETIVWAYAALLAPLKAVHGERKARSGLYGAIMNFHDRQEAEAAAERERLQAEQRAREEAAAAARRTADEKKAGGTGTISDELEAAAAQDAADLAATRAGAVRPAPIRAPLAQVNSRREIEFKLTDSRKALGWLLKNRRTAIEQAARTILGAHLRSIGVDALERDGADIPGIEVSIRREAAIGR